jgi:hypothetical protein
MQISRFPRWLMYATVILALGACAKKDFKMTTPEADYEKAKKMVMVQKDYNTAAYFLEKYASEHP